MTMRARQLPKDGDKIRFAVEIDAPGSTFSEPSVDPEQLAEPPARRRGKIADEQAENMSEEEREAAGIEAAEADSPPPEGEEEDESQVNPVMIATITEYDMERKNLSPELIDRVLSVLRFRPQREGEVEKHAQETYRGHAPLEQIQKDEEGEGVDTRSEGVGEGEEGDAAKGEAGRETGSTGQDVLKGSSKKLSKKGRKEEEKRRRREEVLRNAGRDTDNPTEGEKGAAMGTTGTGSSTGTGVPTPVGSTNQPPGPESSPDSANKK